MASPEYINENGANVLSAQEERDGLHYEEHRSLREVPVDISSLYHKNGFCLN